MGLADQIVMREAALEQVLGDDSVLEALGIAARLGHEGRAELELQGVAAQRVRIVARVLVRYQGTDTALPCELPAERGSAGGGRRRRFVHSSKRAYRRRFAFLMPHLPLIIEAIAVECIGGGDGTPAIPSAGAAAAVPYAPSRAPRDADVLPRR